MIWINGNAWPAGGVCEYLGSSNNYAQAVRIGRIKSFVVVEYTVGDNQRREKTVFVHLARFANESLSSVGTPSCPHYRVRLTRCTETETFVHVSTMATLLTDVPDNRGRTGVPLFTPNDNSCPTGYMYLVPVAKAFETVSI